ncbi:MAG: type transport system permease protein, partial [Actinomycetota bacterium]|nr:type transport system permease protein [Actinomycetota bacterium]
AFARANPVTHVVDALRALFLGGPAARSVWLSLVWIAAILAVFVPLSVARFRRL